MLKKTTIYLVIAVATLCLALGPLSGPVSASTNTPLSLSLPAHSAPPPFPPFPRPRPSWPPYYPWYQDWSVYPYYLNQPAPQPLQPAVISFTAAPSTINPGQAVTLTWSTSNATSVTISQIGAVSTAGTMTVVPTSSTTYTLTVSGDVNTTAATSTAYITVKPWQPPAISLGQASIKEGKSTVMSWDAPGAARVTISGVGSVGISGSASIGPQANTTYNLTASYPDGTTQYASATLVVEANEPPYLLYGLIALLAIAAVIIVLLLVRRPAKQAAGAGTSRVTSATATGESAQDMAITTTPATTPLAGPAIEEQAAQLVADNGAALPIRIGGPMGRSDFQLAAGPEKANLISRQHIFTGWDNGRFFIEDTGSTNGTRLNDDEIKGTGKHTLTDGDVIDIGKAVHLTFRTGKPEETGRMLKPGSPAD